MENGQPLTTLWTQSSDREDKVNVAATTELKHLVNSLIKADDKPKVKGSCHNCGKPGHWAKDFPEPKRDHKSGNSNIARSKGRWNNPKKNKEECLVETHHCTQTRRKRDQVH